MATFRVELVQAAKVELGRFGGRSETDPSVRDFLVEYWTSGTGRSEKAAAAEIKTRTAWSAAFLSFIVKKALRASGSKAKFEFSASHSVYAGAAIRNDQSAVTGPAFLGLPPSDAGAAPPEVGDLIGVTRQRSIDDYGDALTAARQHETYFSHFDVVTDRSGGKITTIGGNVSNTVRTKTFTLGSNGLLPKLPFKFDSAGAVLSGPFICIIKHRDG